MMRPVGERLWEQVTQDPESDCWIWRGSRYPTGYGRVYIGARRTASVHRVAYEQLRAEIPTGLVLDHLCRTPLCVNPWHLEPVTIAENTRRGRAWDVVRARHAARTHCAHGHPMSGDNLRIARDGSRICKTCKRDWWRARNWPEGRAEAPRRIGRAS